MSNKITGSDLERLINEAMGLKVEVDRDPNDDNIDLDFKAASVGLDTFAPDDEEQELPGISSDDEEGNQKEDEVTFKKLSKNEIEEIATAVKDVEIIEGQLALIFKPARNTLSKLSVSKKIAKGELPNPDDHKDTGYMDVLEILKNKSATLKPYLDKVKFEDIPLTRFYNTYFRGRVLPVEISKNELVKIRTELLPPEALFGSGWNINDDFPNFLKVQNLNMDTIIKDLKLISNLAEPKNKVTDDDISSLMMGNFRAGKTKEESEEDKKRRENLLKVRQRIKKWLIALVNKFKALEQNNLARLAKNLYAKADQISRTEYDPSARTFAPDVDIKTSYRSAGSFQKTPPYIEEIFKTFGALSGASIKDRVEEINKISKVLFNPTEPVLEQAVKIQTDSGLGFEAAGQNFSRLMVLDLFKSIVIDLGKSDAKQAGNVFESFLALLIDGTTEGGSFDFDDVISRNNDGTISFISLKLLGMQSQVTQSYRTIANFYKKHGTQATIKYFLAQKDVYSDGPFYKIPIFLKEIKYSDIFDETGKLKNEFKGYTTQKDVDGDDGETVKKTVTDYQSYDNEITYFPPGSEIMKVGAKDPKKVLKTAAGSGVVVFGINFIKENKPVAEILIPKDEEAYNIEMKKSFDSIDTSIGIISENLKLFESRITKYYASPNYTSRQASANKAYNNLMTMKKEMDDKIFRSDTEVVTSEKQTNESKSNPVDIKKLIEESFKK